MPPLVIWGVAIGAEELFGLGVLATGATIVAQQNARGGSLARSHLGTTTLTCATCNQAPDPCEQLGRDVRTRQDELAKRYQDMREDKLGLYNAGPAGVPGAGTWDGHVQQFVQKQANLRKTLASWGSNGCGNPPDGAWKDATRDPPTQPAPR